MKNNIKQFNKCANCGACYNICPTKAITVKEEMFYMIDVDDSRCVNCGKCVEICPVNTTQYTQNIINAYGGYNKDNNIVLKSSSGGAFFTLANHILSEGGIVFGATFSDDNKRVFINNTDEVSLEKLLKSKYVESNVGASFKEAKEQLEKNRKVLYCGCPCQIAGLKRYLQKDYKNLYTCDFSCGGLPSNKLYKEYLEHLEKKYKSKISSVDFRPKTYGWSTYAIKICFKNGKKYNSLAKIDPYFSGFIYNHYTVRDNCLTCQFADNHYSDIILADFWLYKKLSDLPAGNGLSLIITNSFKGEELLKSVKDKMLLKSLEIEKATYNIKKPSVSEEFIKNRHAFLLQAKEQGLIKSAKKHCLPSLQKQIVIKIKKRIKKMLK